MRANYHTHTYRCHHAVGSEEEYIEKAIAEGIKILGFSDHAPNIFPDGYVSGHKMLPSEADGYFSHIRSLAQKYRDKIKIYVGYETEYYREYWRPTLDMWAHNPPDYLILGQHFVFSEWGGDMSSSVPTTDAQRLGHYVDRVIEALDTGFFSCLAHPDILNFKGDAAEYRRHMSRLIRRAVSLDIPLEINLLGLSSKRHYPRDDFWALAGELGAKAIIGCDAHNPERVADKEEIKAGAEIAKRHNLELVDSIRLIDFTAKYNALISNSHP